MPSDDALDNATGAETENEEAWRELREIFVDLKRRALGYWYIHNHDFARNRTLRLGLSIPAIVLSGASGISIFSSLSTPETECEPVYATILLGCVEVFSVILGSLQTYFNFGAAMTRHKEAAALYHGFASEIDEQLALPVRRRKQAVDFYEDLSQRYQDLQKKCSADISERSRERLRRFAEGGGGGLANEFFEFSTEPRS